MAEDETRPLSFRFAKWYGYIFSGAFILYGGVKIILSFLDRNYEEMATPILFLVVGLVLIALVMAFKQLKRWGWYGMLLLNGLIVVAALFGLGHFENIILLVLSAATMYMLLAPPTKEYFIKGK